MRFVHSGHTQGTFGEKHTRLYVDCEEKNQNPQIRFLACMTGYVEMTFNEIAKPYERTDTVGGWGVG